MFKRSIVPVGFMGAIAAIIAIAFFTVTRSETNTFALYKESGEVYYKKDITDNYTLLDENDIRLEHKSFVKTKTGYAHIVFEDGSMLSMDNDTEVQVLLVEGTITVKEQLGNVWSRVSDNKQYSVETLSSTSEAKGTIFDVQYEDGDKQLSSVYVVEGSVSVKQIIEQNGKKTENGPYDLPSGKKLSFSPKTDFSTITAVDFDENLVASKWYKRNLIIDGEFNKQFAKKFVSNIKNLTEIMKLEGGKEQTAEEKSKDILTKIEEIDSVKNSDVYEFLQKFQLDYDFTVAGADVCVNINSDQFAEDKEDLAQYKDEIGEANYNQLIKYVDKLKEMCSDDELSDEETEELKTIFYEQYEEEKDKEESKFKAAIQSKLSLYLEINNDGEEVCARVNDASTDNIIDDLEAIETQYNQPHEIAEKIRPVLEKIATSCNDNKISIDELKDIESLTPSEYFQ